MEPTTQSGSVLTVSEENIAEFGEVSMEQVAEVLAVGFDNYQAAVENLKVYPETATVIYPALGLAGEAGEVVEKVKKWIRDDIFNVADLDIQQAALYKEMGETRREAIAQELGDVLWYVTALASDIGYDLFEISQINLHKLYDRTQRDQINGDGDDR